jgi:hypothetical protein
MMQSTRLKCARPPLQKPAHECELTKRHRLLVCVFFFLNSSQKGQISHSPSSSHQRSTPGKKNVRITRISQWKWVEMDLSCQLLLKV